MASVIVTHLVLGGEAPFAFCGWFDPVHPAARLENSLNTERFPVHG